jgi:hypothetical protein
VKKQREGGWVGGGFPARDSLPILFPISPYDYHRRLLNSHAKFRNLFRPLSALHHTQSTRESCP